MITIEEQIKEVVREIALRRNVYGKMVKANRMKQDDADMRIARMEAVLETLKARLANDQASTGPPAA